MHGLIFTMGVVWYRHFSTERTTTTHSSSTVVPEPQRSTPPTSDSLSAVLKMVGSKYSVAVHRDDTVGDAVERKLGVARMAREDRKTRQNKITNRYIYYRLVK